ncbi:hypothetical protein ACVGOW_22325 [Pseudonocardia saturnea]
MGVRTMAPGRAAVALLVAAGLAAGLGGCGGSAGPDRGTTLEDLQAEGAPADGADEGDIAAGPDDTELFLPDQASYLGREVTVSGRIVEVFSPEVFAIGEGDLATLVTRPDTALTLQPGATAQVTGTVGPFVIVDVEEELGTDLIDADFRAFEGAPFVRAADVNLLDTDR